MQTLLEKLLSLLESRKRDENSERPWDVTQTLKQTKDNAIVVIVIT